MSPRFGFSVPPEAEQANLSSILISRVWKALGGGPLRHGRGRAIWRKGNGYSVSLSDDKGVWYDFRDSIGGGLLDLVQHARGCSRGEAYLWIAAEFHLATSDLTPAERAAYGRARIQGRDLARRAACFASFRLPRSPYRQR